MHDHSCKFVALLLSLLLALLPLQGLVAAEMSMPPAQHGAHDLALDASAMMDMGTDCDDCTEQADCCDGGNCDLHQCASCVSMAFLPQSFLSVPSRTVEFSLLTGSADLPSPQASLYRPPRG